jgi:Glyoxalase-like domain
VSAVSDGSERQLPDDDELFLDHVGHFIRDPDAAGQALRRVGFSPTPISIQFSPDAAGGESPTGTGNITAMLRRGYVEALFKSADTPLGRELDAAIARYSGVHLAAFSVRDAAAAHRRLDAAGFRVRPLVHMQRPVATEKGKDVAAFTVVRVERGAMAEGRIQILNHRTEAAVWQPRWLDHPNGATGLIDLVIATAEPAEAAMRFARFLDRPAAENAAGHVVRLDRGRIQFVTPEMLTQFAPGLKIPSLPFIGLYAVAVRSLARLAQHLSSNGVAFARHADLILVHFPEEVGIGAWIFVERPSDLPWRS